MGTIDLTRPAAYDPDAVAAWEDATPLYARAQAPPPAPAQDHRRAGFRRRARRRLRQPFLLRRRGPTLRVAGFGCDLADRGHRREPRVLPGCEFRTPRPDCRDLAGRAQFDLVVCSEVLEHLDDWPDGGGEPGGNDARTFSSRSPAGRSGRWTGWWGTSGTSGPELARALEGQGCRVVRVNAGDGRCTRRTSWRSAVSPRQRLYAAFSGGGRYGAGKRIVSELLYGLFFLNDCAARGHQLIIHAQRGEPVMTAHITRSLLKRGDRPSTGLQAARRGRRRRLSRSSCPA